jgi:hypothetical protein
VRSIPLSASNFPKFFLTLLNTMAFFIGMNAASFLNETYGCKI